MTVRGVVPSATTTIAAVIGDPVRHSLSPVLLNTAFACAGVDWSYGAFEVPAGHADAAIAAMRALGLGGLNVTMPHKEAVVEQLDDLSPVARRLGAVNCVAWQGGRLVGHSTDGDGLVGTLRAEEGFEPESRRCLVVGAGGAARAAIAALGDAGAAEVVVVNRTPERAHAAAALAGTRGRVGSTADVADVDLVVNATPSGMAGTSGPDLPLDPGLLGAGQVVLDMVYSPTVTPLVAAARAAGVHAVGGVGMLVRQAARSFTLWTGLEAPVGDMTTAVAAALATREGT